MSYIKELTKIDINKNTLVRNEEKTDNFLIFVNQGENGFFASCEK